MSQLTRKEIDLFSQKILEDYDANNPSTIFKDKIKINNSDALIIQSTVTKLREKRGEEVIGFKIGKILIDQPYPFGLIKVFEPNLEDFKDNVLLANKKECKFLEYV